MLRRRQGDLPDARQEFLLLILFLPADKRNAAYAVYAFCRLLDDATDEAPDASEVSRQIDRFENLLGEIYSGDLNLAGFDQESSKAMMAFVATVKKYAIPRQCFVEIAEGCRMDLTISRYQTWNELRTYCYRVAGVVGLIMCKIFGLDDPAAEQQAILMGEAMQLTNILRDVGEDFQRGRIYLPLEDLARFGYIEQQLAGRIVNESFVQLMQFEIDRARMLYHEGAVGLRQLSNDGSRFTAAAMGVIYSGILQAIEKQNYDVFSNRARLSLPQKLLRLPAARRLARCEGNAEVPNIF